MYAQIISGEADSADVLFLVAVCLFVVAGVVRFTRHAEHALTFIAFGLAAVALAYLVL